ncbi:MAG TPA: CRTAC1 family protein [Pseudobdellovibrionaceae bacterium]|nr:CRTAC1 family protein [Pseudobdellovibrionaceae bacterium]
MAIRDIFLPALVGLSLIATLWGREALRDVPGGGGPRRPAQVSHLSFAEMAAPSGLHFTHQLAFPNPHAPRAVLEFNAIYPSVAVADLDGDGELDLVLTSPDQEVGVRIFQGSRSGRWQDVTRAWRLSAGDMVSRVIAADVNGDGRADLLMSRYGCHQVFVQVQRAGPPQFAEIPDAFGGVCSNAVGLNVGDLDGDSHLDVMLANYWFEDDLREKIPRTPRLRSTWLSQTGGQSQILWGDGTGKFRAAAEAHRSIAHLPRSYANNFSLFDVDADGRLDFYQANDYQFDRLVLNRPEGFIDVTDQYIPRRFHGLNGMNTDVGDWNGDGLLDLYVGNISAPPFMAYNNVLWTRSSEGGFFDASRSTGTGNCGWTWSGRWADFDNDSRLDLFVVNGRFRGRGATEAQAGSLWHARAMATDIPAFLRALDPSIDYPSTARRQLSSFQASCLFVQQDGGRFEDHARASGVTDLEDGYGVASLDFNHDGRMDLVVVNRAAPVMLYVNQTQQVGDWLGVELRNRAGRPATWGSLVELRGADGWKRVALAYPTNTFNSQSDPRLHFGLGDAKGPFEVEVQWRKGVREVFQLTHHNAYHRIQEGTGSSR